MTPEYTYTTIEWAEPDVWRHPRDKRDAEQGREDVGPIDDPVLEAIAHEFAVHEELLTVVCHLQAERDPEVSVDLEVTVDV